MSSQNNIQQLDLLSACLFKFYLTSPNASSNKKDIGSVKHLEHLLENEDVKANQQLSNLLKNIKRQTFRSKSNKMADLASAYNASGYAQAAQANLPHEMQSVRLNAPVKKTKKADVGGGKSPHFRMPATSGTFQQVHYETTNVHGIPVPEEVTYTVHMIEMLPSVCAGDLKHEWTNDHQMKISFKHSDPMSFPMMLLPLFHRGGKLAYGQDSALATSMEQNVAGKRGPDGHVWDGAVISYPEPQDPATYSPGDGLTGFDIVEVPHVRTDGIEVAINMLIVCTRTPKAVKQTVDVGFAKSQIKLQSTWGPQAANGGGGFQNPFNFGSPSFSPYTTSNGNQQNAAAFGNNQFGMPPCAAPSNSNQHNAATFGNQFGAQQPPPARSNGIQRNQFGTHSQNPATFGNQFGSMQPPPNPFAAPSNPSNGMQPSPICKKQQPRAVPSFGHPPSQINVSKVRLAEPGDAASTSSALSYDNGGHMSVASLTSQVENLARELENQKAAAEQVKAMAEQEKQQLMHHLNHQHQQLQTAEAIVYQAEAEKQTAEELQRVALQEKTFAENVKEQASVVLQRAEAQRKLGTHKRMRPELERGASAENEEGGTTPMTDRKPPPHCIASSAICCDPSLSSSLPSR
ncbi:unnamed protein product [Cylindrotheca closterium]|uniref:Uncharacterized protein n=1 Tax=Cylindrotheca closterium TaxID=2856 RepID=A0AAD2FXT4_9STRA|nr:unnamed protein product [Cylindrotheca closterium]